PDDNRLNTTYVGNIDTGIYLNPAIGLPFINWICDSITAEPPIDTMGHGSWTHSCAFGQPCLSRYGTFIPVALAPSSYHVKVFTAFGPCSSFQIMKAMEMCAVKGCRVVNMSLGGPLEGSVEEDPECVLAEKLYRQYGTNFVVAAGNDGEEWSINSPGASPYVLCVAAMDWKAMDTSSYSSRGPQARWYMENKDAYDRDYAKYGENFLKPDVAGIGGDRESQIVAAVSLWYDAFYDLVPDGFDLMIGTSMATPHVAGLVALAIDKGLVGNIDDVKARMARFGEKSANKGYGLLTWSKLQ
ncbi:MAG: S8 family serine peptidase, partial [Thermoproteota archaeon]